MSEKKVMQRVTDNAEDIARSIKEYGGVSFSPRQNRIFETGKDYGDMMSVVREAVDARSPAVDNVEELAKRVVETAQNSPELLRRLRRGENLGGWISKGELVLDPSKRFINRNTAILRGMKANQDAGFNLSTAEEIDLKNVLSQDPVTGKKTYGAINEELKRQALLRLLGETATVGAVVPAAGILGANVIYPND
jgi:hypothetical protein